MKQGISQEGLKLIACITMLIDHIGYAVVYPLCSGLLRYNSDLSAQAEILYDGYLLCRSVGRLAFPIFAFLLVEGIHHSRNRKRYALRLLLAAVLSELPYDLVTSGGFSWHKQSVMVTLLLGFGAVMAMENCRSLAWKPVVAIPFAVLAELLMTDYGWAGIALIALMALSREGFRPNLMRTGGMIVLFHHMPSHIFYLGGFSVPMQVLGAFSALFIANYNGQKLTQNKIVQYGFYLFYPAHLLLLWIIGRFIPVMIRFYSGIAL